MRRVSFPHASTLKKQKIYENAIPPQQIFSFIHIFLLFAVSPYSGWGGGGGAKWHPPSTSFSSVTSGNVGINPKNFLTLRVNPFATLV